MSSLQFDEQFYSFDFIVILHVVPIILKPTRSLERSWGFFPQRVQYFQKRMPSRFSIRRPAFGRIWHGIPTCTKITTATLAASAAASAATTTTTTTTTTTKPCILIQAIYHAVLSV